MPVRDQEISTAAFDAAYDEVLTHWPPTLTRIRIRTEFGRTHVNACGPADAPPLVLLHGGGATAAAWYRNVAELSRSHRVFAVDRPGEPGRLAASAPSDPATRRLRAPADLHAWLDAVLDELGVPAAALCGHSYGAWIALTYALHAPARVTALVLLDPTRCFGGFRPGYLLRALPSLVRPSASRSRAFLDWETGGATAAPESPADRAWIRLYELAATYPDARVVVGRRPKADALRELAVPTSVVLAGRSRTHAPARIAAAAARALPDVETAVLDGVSHHAMPWSRADELNRRVTEFLARPPR